MKKHLSLLLVLIIIPDTFIVAGKKASDDTFALGKSIAKSEKDLEKNHDYEKLDNLPSWDPGYGAPAWLTKPGAKVIVPRSDDSYTYGIVLRMQDQILTVIVEKRSDGSYKTKKFSLERCSELKWVHKSWISKKRKDILINKEKAFVNYNAITKNFQKLSL